MLSAFLNLHFANLAPLIIYTYVFQKSIHTPFIFYMIARFICLIMNNIYYYTTKRFPLHLIYFNTIEFTECVWVILYTDNE